jgi:arsenate reductase
MRAATHPHRYRLLRMLRGGPRTVSWLVDQTGLAANLVSHHLRELRRQRLVAVRQYGRERRYMLDEKAVAAAAQEFVASLNAEIKATAPRPRVLFVCVHNAGRSQMALAFFERFAGDAAIGDAAGSEPAPQIHPMVRDAMTELGYTIRRKPQQVTATMVTDADLVIDLGCGDAIPDVLGMRRVTWRIKDPDGLPLTEVRVIRNELRRRVRALSRDLRTRAATA